jgi:hypothetical protein
MSLLSSVIVLAAALLAMRIDASTVVDGTTSSTVTAATKPRALMGMMGKGGYSYDYDYDYDYSRGYGGKGKGYSYGMSYYNRGYGNGGKGMGHHIFSNDDEYEYNNGDDKYYYGGKGKVRNR